MTDKHCGIIITNIGQLVTYNEADDILYGTAMNKLNIIENGAIAINNDEIVAVGTSREIIGNYQAHNYIDAREMLVTPGLIDCHTHPVFLKTRAEEFEMRLAGRNYEEILEAGGGIHNSAAALRSANPEFLRNLVKSRINLFLENGTTTLEAKTGYGLNKFSELMSLEILHKINGFSPVDIVSTFLGAHVVPAEFTDKREEYIKLIIEMLPEIAERKLAEYVDVFIEENAFTAEEATEICTEATKHGLKIRLHVNQFNNIGGIKTAAEVGSLTVEHLEVLNDDDIKIIKKKNLIPVLLPGCSFFLNDNRYPYARKLIDADLPVVIATDFNPGSSYIMSLPFIMSLSVLHMDMTPAEALTACTINAAYALERGDKIGKIKEGYKADIVIWKVPHYQELSYSIAQNQVNTVIKNGRIVV
ncbi:MAG: imidazolonepropionase [Planctomycetes bacterium]|nr:imidazolonepropionase [Planctomycetota bacterium]